MQVRMVRAHFASKVGLANYSNIEAGVELGADVEEGEDWKEVLAELLLSAKTAAKEALTAKKAVPEATPQEQVEFEKNKRTALANLEELRASPDDDLPEAFRAPY